MIRSRTRRGFSLIELVIVIVIIGIIAAIAIPRMSRGSAGAGDSALSGDLSVLRNAIDMYNTEHQAFPAGTATNVSDVLTKFTDASGNVSTTKTSTYMYGPYLRKVPALPVGTNKGSIVFKVTNGATPAAPGVAGSTEAWLYNSDTGDVWCNDPSTDVDQSGKAYNTY